MIVMKFGGSSLAGADRIRHVAQLLRANIENNPIIVLSAIGKTTDELIETGRAALGGKPDPTKIAHAHLKILEELNLPQTVIADVLEEFSGVLQGISLLHELTPKTMDHLLSFGERFSTRIFSAHLSQEGISAEAVEGWNAGLVTTSNFNKAELLNESYERIRTAFSSRKSKVPVVTGFIAKDANGAITTLGRGGSDLTAAILGAALNVREIQVWKDVHGILSTDPRILEAAFPIPSISFEEAAELAYFGAKVLHPMSILPAMKKNIPVRVKNSYDPMHPGTLILSDMVHNNGLVTAITYKPGQAMVHICSTRMLGQYGFLAKVFQIFEDMKISVDVIATSEVSISLTLENQEGIAELQRRLSEIATVDVQLHKTIVSLIGSTKYSSQILERALKTLSDGGIGVQMISHGASNVNTSMVVNDSEAKKSIHLLHEHFFQRQR